MIPIGDFHLHLLSDGTLGVDGGAMFGVVPRVMWEQTDPPDEKNRVTLALNVPLVEAGGKRILVDPGIGDKWGPKEARNYRIERRESLLGGLRSLSLGPADIDLVVNTAKDVTAEQINAAFKAAAGKTPDIIEYCEEKLVSMDFKGNTHSAIFQSPDTMVIGGNMVKVLAWYDNEWGYSCRLGDLVAYIASKGL